MTKNPGGTEILPSGIVGVLELGSDNPDDRRRRSYRQMHMDSSGQPRADLWLAGVAATKRLAITGSLNNLGVQWQQIGPAPLIIDAQQNFMGKSPCGGEVTDIAIDPTSSDQTIYIATNDGGVWKTTDGGTTWAPKTDFTLQRWRRRRYKNSQKS